MSGPKFKKKYNDTTVEKTISFFRKRMSDKKESLICNSVEKILKECNEDTRNGIVLYLNRFSKWYAHAAGAQGIVISDSGVVYQAARREVIVMSDDRVFIDDHPLPHMIVFSHPAVDAMSSR